MLESFIKNRVEKKGIAVMAHLICGYPGFKENWDVLETMEEAGVDLVELQFPFSEPIADGPLFLKANQESLEKGTKVNDCFDLMQKASKAFSFKTLMMGYYNTVFTAGEANFCRRVNDCGGTGLIVPDIPLEEAAGLEAECKANDLSLIRLVAPTNTQSRINQLLKGAKGFVYAVARKGVTGPKTAFSHDIEGYLQTLKTQSPVPVAVGFGISSAEDIDYLRGKADIAVIGTAVLKAYLKDGKSGVSGFFGSLKLIK
jgi:tryptophan synthase alpha chain